MAYKNYDDEMLLLAAETWHGFLADLDVRLVFSIVQNHAAMNKNPYPPTIAEILEAYQKAVNPHAFIRPEEAWESVRKAINLYGSYRQVEAMDYLSTNVVKAVKTIGWQNLCKADNVSFSYMKRDFMLAYENVDKEDRQSFINPKAMQIQSEILKRMALPNRSGDKNEVQ